MSVEQLIEDSDFLKKAHRYHGALALLLCAVDASSSKMYPKGTKSILNPSKLMPNGERFKTCLGYALRRDLSGFEPDLADYNSPSITINYGGENIILQNILYHEYRCNLIHEGGLPSTVGFEDLHNTPGLADINGFRFVVRGNSLVLDVECLSFIKRVISNLPVNGGAHLEKKPIKKELIFKDDVDVNELFEHLKKKYKLREGKIEHIAEFFYIDNYIDTDFKSMSNEFVKDKFKSAIDNKKINNGIISSIGFVYDDEDFNTYSYISKEGVLTDEGVDIVKYLSGKYKLV